MLRGLQELIAASHQVELPVSVPAHLSVAEIQQHRDLLGEVLANPRRRGLRALSLEPRHAEADSVAEDVPTPGARMN